MALVVPSERLNDSRSPMSIGESWAITGHENNIKNMILWAEHTPEELMMRLTKIICQKYNLDLFRLSGIQRKFLTHYRCSNCGLLPLYFVNVSHIKRVRCGRCGELISFRRKGKYGRLRKDIALEITRVKREVGGS